MSAARQNKSGVGYSSCEIRVPESTVSRPVPGTGLLAHCPRSLEGHLRSALRDDASEQAQDRRAGTQPVIVNCTGSPYIAHGPCDADVEPRIHRDPVTLGCLELRLSPHPSRWHLLDGAPPSSWHRPYSDLLVAGTDPVPVNLPGLQGWPDCTSGVLASHCFIVAATRSQHVLYDVHVQHDARATVLAFPE